MDYEPSDGASWDEFDTANRDLKEVSRPATCSAEAPLAPIGSEGKKDREGRINEHPLTPGNTSHSTQYYDAYTFSTSPTWGF